MKDYHKILGVSPNVNKADLKKAYRKLALKYHPDKNNGDKASEQKFKEVSEAYEMLNNPSKMRNAANSRGGFRNNRGFDGFGGFDINDMFRSHFGQGFTSGQNRNQPRRGKDNKFEVKVSLHDILAESKKDMDLSYKEACGACNGTTAKDMKTCSVCKGAGVVQQHRSNGHINMVNNVPCMHCNATGTIIKEKCSECADGSTYIKRPFNFSIPPASNNGTVLRFAGQGCKGVFGGPNGDLFLKLVLVLPTKEKLTNEQLDTLKAIQ